MKNLFKITGPQFRFLLFISIIFSINFAIFTYFSSMDREIFYGDFMISYYPGPIVSGLIEVYSNFSWLFVGYPHRYYVSYPLLLLILFISRYRFLLLDKWGALFSFLSVLSFLPGLSKTLFPDDSPLFRVLDILSKLWGIPAALYLSLLLMASVLFYSNAGHDWESIRARLLRALPLFLLILAALHLTTEYLLYNIEMDLKFRNIFFGSAAQLFRYVLGFVGALVILCTLMGVDLRRIFSRYHLLPFLFLFAILGVGMGGWHLLTNFSIAKFGYENIILFLLNQWIRFFASGYALVVIINSIETVSRRESASQISPGAGGKAGIAEQNI